jgi:hypothetical protein
MTVEASKITLFPPEIRCADASASSCRLPLREPKKIFQSPLERENSKNYLNSAGANGPA